MITKIFGMILVIFSCGGVGFKIAADHRREERFLRQFIDVLNYMEWELKFRMTPLPDLCRKIATEYNNAIGNVFYDLAFEMDKQQNSDLSSCLTNVLNSKNIMRFFHIFYLLFSISYKNLTINIIFFLFSLLTL